MSRSKYEDKNVSFLRYIGKNSEKWVSDRIYRELVSMKLFPLYIACSLRAETQTRTTSPRLLAASEGVMAQ